MMYVIGDKVEHEGDEVTFLCLDDSPLGIAVVEDEDAKEHRVPLDELGEVVEKSYVRSMINHGKSAK